MRRNYLWQKKEKEKAIEKDQLSEKDLEKASGGAVDMFLPIKSNAGETPDDPAAATTTK